MTSLFTRCSQVLLAIVVTVLLAPAQAACVTGASVDSTKSALLNPLLGGLLGTQLNLSAADWNTLAQGDVNLLGLLSTLNAGAGTPAQALNANVTLGQITAALGNQAQSQANPNLANALNNLSTLARRGPAVTQAPVTVHAAGAS